MFCRTDDTQPETKDVNPEIIVITLTSELEKCKKVELEKHTRAQPKVGENLSFEKVWSVDITSCEGLLEHPLRLVDYFSGKALDENRPDGRQLECSISRIQ